MRSFPKDRYISEQWAQQEWEQVWCRGWQAAAHISDLRSPGDFVVYDIGRESVLLACGADEKIRAFYNVCQHRGLRLVDDDCGHSPSFRCPYHSWRYSNEGALEHVPHQEGFAGELPEQGMGLTELPCEVALGFAWISLDPGAEELTEYLKDMVPLLGHYEFENMQLMQDQTVSVNCNWKAVLDNFSELYHVPYLHPQHRRFVDCTTATNELYEGGHTRVVVPGATTDSLFSVPDEPTDILIMQLTALGLNPQDYHGRVPDIQQAVRVAKRELGQSSVPYYANFTDEELTDVMQTNVFPNAVFSYSPEMCWLIRPRPHPTDPNRCYLDKLSFERTATPVEESVRPERDSFDYQDVIEGRKSMTDTIDQDLSLLAHAQQGMQSAGFKEVWLNDVEVRISHFHEHLNQCVGEAG